MVTGGGGAPQGAGPGASAADPSSPPFDDGSGSPAVAPRRAPRLPSLARVPARALAAVRSILSRQDRLFRLGISVILAAVFTGSIYYFTGGGLLYAMDNVGAYSWQDFFLRPRTDYLLPSLASGLVLGGTYTAFYLTVFLETFLVVFAIQTFCRALLRRTLGRWDLRFAEIIAGALFLASPVMITYRYASILSTLYVSTAALTFVFAFLIEALRGLRENVPFTWKQGLLLGVALGMSGPDSLPNDARVVAVEALALVAFLLAYLIIATTDAERRRAATRSLANVWLLAVPIGAAMLAYPFYVFLTSKGFGISTVNSVASAFAPQLASGPWNTLDATVRLLGRRSFMAAPFYLQYYASSTTLSAMVVAATYLLPLLALVVPLVIAVLWEFPDRWLVAPVTVLSIVGGIWEAGSNQPLGPLYTTVVGYLPYGSTFFQTYSIVNLLLDKFYPVLIAFSIVTISRIAYPLLLARAAAPVAATPGIPSWDRLMWARPRGRVPRRVPGIRAGILVLLTGSVAFAALPILNGSVDQNWIPPSSPGYGERGMFIPSEYPTVRTILHEKHGNAVLLPQVTAYVRTTWGYNGANGFYQAFYYPDQILVPGYFGPYASYIPSLVQNYTSATNPLIPAGAGTALNASFATIVHPSIPATPAAGSIRYDFRLASASAVVNASRATWLTVSVGVSNVSRMRTVIDDGNLWLGLTSGSLNTNTPVWFNVAQGSNAVLDSLNNVTGLTVSLMAADPGAPPPNTGERGGYNPAKIDVVTIWVREPVATFGFVQGLPVLSASNTTAIAPWWVPQLESYHMGYVLVDHSLLLNGSTGNLQTPGLVGAIVSGLLASGVLQPLFLGHDLDLYQLVAAPTVAAATVPGGPSR